MRPLVIDELGYLTLKPEQANAFFRLMDQPKSGSWMIASVGRIGGICGHGDQTSCHRCSPTG
jgi:hypothetical protein